MKRSLTLASIMALAPLSLALGIQDVQFTADVGSRTVTIGNSTETSKKNLLGGAPSTTSAAAAGTVTSIKHTTLMAVVGASATVPFGTGSDYGVKVAAELHVSNSDTHKAYDGVSQTATVAVYHYPAVLGSTSGDKGGNDAKAAYVSLGTISAGRRECTVAHQHAYGLKALYAFGEQNHGAAVGLGLLWTKDEYKYLVDVAPTGGAGTGVYSAGDETAGFSVDGTSSDQTILANGTDSGSQEGTDSYTVVAGTQSKFDDTVMWHGLVAEASTQLNENIAVRGGYGYYMRQFDVSKGATVSAPMIATASDATMTTGFVGVSFQKADN